MSESVEVRWVRREEWATTTHAVSDFHPDSDRPQIRSKIEHQASEQIEGADWVAHNIEEAVERLWSFKREELAAQQRLERQNKRATRDQRIMDNMKARRLQ